MSNEKVEHKALPVRLPSETTPRQANGQPQVGFVESWLVEPELLEVILRVRSGKGVDR